MNVKQAQARQRRMSRLAETTNMDRIVRILANSGRSDEAGINFRAKWEGCTIKATFGAGTNETSLVKEDGTVLYLAYNFGRNVIVFRFGDWVERITIAADKARSVREAERAVDEDGDAQDILDNFSNVDF